MPEYRCEQCNKPCGVRMYESGIGADCHEEAYLLVEDDGLWRHLTAHEELELTEAWWADNDETPHERARQAFLNRS